MVVEIQQIGSVFVRDICRTGGVVVHPALHVRVAVKALHNETGLRDRFSRFAFFADEIAVDGVTVSVVSGVFRVQSRSGRDGCDRGFAPEYR